ncbi:hypothetical protein Dimus_016144, partial [Dionaea muscipula]
TLNDDLRREIARLTEEVDSPRNSHQRKRVDILTSKVSQLQNEQDDLKIERNMSLIK